MCEFFGRQPGSPDKHKVCLRVCVCVCVCVCLLHEASLASLVKMSVRTCVPGAYRCSAYHGHPFPPTHIHPNGADPPHRRLQIKLVMLYALRFEQDGLRIRQLQDLLVTAGIRDR